MSKSGSVSQTDFVTSLMRRAADFLSPPVAEMTPSEWAEKYRMLSNRKPWTFDGYAFQRELHDNLSPHVVVAKGSQVGVSEVALNRALYAVLHLRTDVYYVFPTVTTANRFSKSRVDTAIRESPVLSKLFTDVHNVGHKGAGGVNLFFGGSNSKPSLEAIPIGMLVLDERDLMNNDNIPAARERLAGHLRKIELDIGKPTIPGYGIWREYVKTDKRRWIIPCLRCGRHQSLDFETNMEWREEKPGTARYKCRHCGQAWTHEERLRAISQGAWVAGNRDGNIPGYHINQLYSPTMTAAEIVGPWLELQREGDEAKKQVFYNGKLGLPYVAEGAQLTKEQVEARIGDYSQFQSSTCATMGVDVTPDGLHYAELAEWSMGRKRTIAILRPSWNELDTLMRQYNVACCVIDANPERTDARRFCERWEDKAYMAFYPNGMKELFTIKENKPEINIARTEALDRMLGRFKAGTVSLPKVSRWLRDYVAHMEAFTRSYEKDRQTGALVTRYPDTGKPDHFGHAAVYDEIAECIARTGMGPRSLGVYVF